jgi:iron complex outermembrane receptor protein
MGFHKNNQGDTEKSVRFKRSMLAMCVMALSAPSFAQDAPKKDDAVEEVVITGMKEALGSAQEIKRNADTVVDSITAKDLGSFPDKSVGEALQRVAGISVSRFAAASDTSHFSAEPAGVVVRGLQQVRSEFNGRDSFSANSSRGLSWGDVSPELMSGVDTYKNQTAELIEGGIAGSINLRTRVPFDQAGDMKALTVNYNYGDLSKKSTPEVSGLYSTRWDTSAGEFGVLGNVAYSKVETASQGVQLFRMNRFRDGFGATAPSLAYLPDGVYFRDNLYERERKGIALAAQWKDHDDKFVLTAQYNRSEYQNGMEEYVLATDMGNASFGQSVFYELPKTSDKLPIPADGTSAFTFDENGLFQTGVLTAPHGWWGSSNTASKGYATMASGKPLTNVCFAWNGCTDSVVEPKNIGMGLISTTRTSLNKNMTQDFGFNVKWNPTETIHALFDLQYVDSTVDNYDISTDNKSYSTATVDLRGVPTVSLSAPPNQNLSSALWADPNNYYLANIMDHLEDSSGHQLAFKADVKFDIESGWVNALKVGYRHADRQQEINNSTYNWNGVSNTWTSDGAAWFNLDNKADAASGFKGYPDVFTTRKWSSSVGGLSTADGANTFVVADINLLQNRKGWAEAMSQTSLGIPASKNGWNPICSGKGNRSSEVAGTCFTPAEMVDISEVTNALYAQLHFGGDELTMFDKPITGNIGVRYIQTDIDSAGGFVFPRLTAADLSTDPVDPPAAGQPAPPVPYKLGKYLSAADTAFMNGGNAVSTASTTHHNILPSLNIKYELNDEMLLRFAISRAMSRPDMGSMRNFISVSKTAPSTASATDPLWIKDSAGNITGAKIVYTASAQNPALKPVTADQVDLAFEYYFAKVGSFTMTAFAKEFHDYIQIGRYNRDFINNGVTRTVEVQSPLNGEGAKLNGIEVAFQRFFDFMPAPFDGLGVQANYTYLNNSGIKNTGLRSDTSNPDAVSGQAPDSVKVDRLEGLSDHSANFVLMYEKDAWAARMAYSWRSEYMITAIDCCVAVPIWTEATGQLDGSIKYSVNENIDIAFQVSNILNEQTVLTQQVTDYDKGGLRMPNAWHENDRRYTLGVRLKY